MQNNLNRHSEFWMAISLLISDAIMLLIAFAVSVLLRWLFGNIHLRLYWSLLPFLAPILAIFAVNKLYSVLGVTPAEEIRRVVFASSLVLLITAFSAFFTRGGLQYSRAILLLFWVFSIPSVVFGRYLMRSFGAKFGFWGVPVVILSDTSRGKELLDALQCNPKSGFRPAAYLSTSGTGVSSTGLFTGEWKEAASLHKVLGISTAVVVTSTLAGQNLMDSLDHYCADYNRIFVVSEFLGQRNLWITPADILGNLGLEINKNLDSDWAAFIKRFGDLILTCVLMTFFLPLLGLIALAIRMDSRGGVFYTHNRLGKGGEIIPVLKFRTMYADAEQRLQEVLNSDSGLKKEWDRFQKLQRDPRITHVGRFLRRWSLDELPQILNVLKGEMSLIGPRPITADEVERYQESIHFYYLVRPGLTGLWQVSGRSSLTYDVRVNLDTYYVRNWSIWLDIYILAKTPLVIFRGEGVS